MRDAGAPARVGDRMHSRLWVSGLRRTTATWSAPVPTPSSSTIASTIASGDTERERPRRIRAKDSASDRRLPSVSTTRSRSRTAAAATTPISASTTMSIAPGSVANRTTSTTARTRRERMRGRRASARSSSRSPASPMWSPRMSHPVSTGWGSRAPGTSAPTRTVGVRVPVLPYWPRRTRTPPHCPADTVARPRRRIGVLVRMAERLGLGTRQPVGEGPSSGVLRRELRVLHRPRDRERRVVPADAGLAGPGCTAPCRSTRSRSRPPGRRTRARRRPAPRTAPAPRRTPRGSRPGPAWASPGRMSTATMNARPRTTRMSLPCGGSHWKWSPRTTPRADRDWLTWTKRVGSPSSSNTGAETISPNQPRSSPNRSGRTTRTSGIAVASTVKGTATSSRGRRPRRAPGP